MMTDDLRTRIAAAIWDALDRQRIVGFGPFVDRETGVIDTSGSDGIDMDEVADAVIAELRLEREDDECGYCHAQLPGCRYVTECTTDE